MEDIFLKALPLPIIKIESDDDVIPDPENGVKDKVDSWDEEIRKKVARFIVCQNEKSFNSALEDYLKCLRYQVTIVTDKRRFIDRALNHIKLFNSFYQEMLDTSLEKCDYLNIMEEIMTVYCNTEMDMIRQIRKRGCNKVEYVKLVKEISQKMCNILSSSLSHSLKHILHVLLKATKHNSEPPPWKDVMNTIYSHFLIQFPLHDYSPESFCRNFLLFERWKEIRRIEDHKDMERTMYLRCRQTPETVKSNKIISSILMPSSVESVTDIVTHLLEGKRSATKSYFAYVENKKNKSVVDEPFSLANLNFDCINDDGLDRENWSEDECSRLFNDIVKDFVSIRTNGFDYSDEETMNSDLNKNKEFPSETTTNVINNDPSDDGDCIVIDDDADDVEIQEKEDARVCVISGSDSDCEFMYWEKVSDTSRKKKKHKRTRQNLHPTSTSFLELLTVKFPKNTGNSNTTDSLKTNSKSTTTLNVSNDDDIEILTDVDETILLDDNDLSSPTQANKNTVTEADELNNKTKSSTQVPEKILNDSVTKLDLSNDSDSKNVSPEKAKPISMTSVDLLDDDDDDVQMSTNEMATSHSSMDVENETPTAISKEASTILEGEKELEEIIKMTSNCEEEQTDKSRSSTEEKSETTSNVLEDLQSIEHNKTCENSEVETGTAKESVNNISTITVSKTADTQNGNVTMETETVSSVQTKTSSTEIPDTSSHESTDAQVEKETVNEKCSNTNLEELHHCSCCLKKRAVIHSPLEHPNEEHESNNLNKENDKECHQSKPKEPAENQKKEHFRSVEIQTDELDNLNNKFTYPLGLITPPSDQPADVNSTLLVNNVYADIPLNDCQKTSTTSIGTEVMDPSGNALNSEKTSGSDSRNLISDQTVAPVTSDEQKSNEEKQILQETANVNEDDDIQMSVEEDKEEEEIGDNNTENLENEGAPFDIDIPEEFIIFKNKRRSDLVPNEKQDSNSEHTTSDTTKDSDKTDCQNVDFADTPVPDAVQSENLNASDYQTVIAYANISATDVETAEELNDTNYPQFLLIDGKHYLINPGSKTGEMNGLISVDFNSHLESVLAGKDFPTLVANNVYLDESGQNCVVESGQNYIIKNSDESIQSIIVNDTAYRYDNALTVEDLNQLNSSNNFVENNITSGCKITEVRGNFNEFSEMEVSENSVIDSSNAVSDENNTDETVKTDAQPQNVNNESSAVSSTTNGETLTQQKNKEDLVSKEQNSVPLNSSSPLSNLSVHKGKTLSEKSAKRPSAYKLENETSKSEKIIFTSKESIKLTDFDKFEKTVNSKLSDLDEQNEMWQDAFSGPVTKLNSVSTDTGFFTTSDEMFDLEGTKEQKEAKENTKPVNNKPSIEVTRSPSLSPVEKSPDYEAIDTTDFEKYIQEKNSSLQKKIVQENISDRKKDSLIIHLDKSKISPSLLLKTTNAKEQLRNKSNKDSHNSQETTDTVSSSSNTTLKSLLKRKRGDSTFVPNKRRVTFGPVTTNVSIDHYDESSSSSARSESEIEHHKPKAINLQEMVALKENLKLNKEKSNHQVQLQEPTSDRKAEKGAINNEINVKRKKGNKKAPEDDKKKIIEAIFRKHQKQKTNNNINDDNANNKRINKELTKEIPKEINTNENAGDSYVKRKNLTAYRKQQIAFARIMKYYNKSKCEYDPKLMEMVPEIQLPLLTEKELLRKWYSSMMVHSTKERWKALERYLKVHHKDPSIKQSCIQERVVYDKTTNSAEVKIYPNSDLATRMSESSTNHSTTGYSSSLNYNTGLRPLYTPTQDKKRSSGADLQKETEEAQPPPKKRGRKPKNSATSVASPSTSEVANKQTRKPRGSSKIRTSNETQSSSSVDSNRLPSDGLYYNRPFRPDINILKPS